MMSPWNLINDFYVKYKNIIHFNKNILLAAIVTAILDVAIVVFASLLYPQNALLVSMVSLVADFAIFNTTFVALFYFGNRDRYWREDGTKDHQKLKKDSIKLVTALGLSEIAYLSTKFFTTYVFFAYGLASSLQISVATTALGWIIYLMVANIMIRNTGFFK
jgi:archaellum biogenesis protein FlaJ (TadC family)